MGEEVLNLSRDHDHFLCGDDQSVCIRRSEPEPLLSVFNDRHNFVQIPVRSIARWIAEHRPDLFFSEVQDVDTLNERLKSVGFSVAKQAPYGICRYCKAELFPEYNVCETCADERSP